MTWRLAGQNAFPDDKHILFGRGKSIFDHRGNQVFRKFIDIHLSTYVSANKRNLKTGIIREISRELRSAGYRFLRLEGGEGVRGRPGATWVPLEDKTVLEKVAHALRDRSPLLEKFNRHKQTPKSREQLDAVHVSAIRWAEQFVGETDADAGYGSSAEQDQGEQGGNVIHTGQEDAPTNQQHGVLPDALTLAQQALGLAPTNNAIAGGNMDMAWNKLMMSSLAGAAPALHEQSRLRSSVVSGAAQSRLGQTHAPAAPADRRLSMIQDAAPSPANAILMGTRQPLEASPNPIAAVINDQTSFFPPPEQPVPNPAPTGPRMNEAQRQEEGKQYYVSIDEIVVPCMQQGGLPHPGNWKFFPEPEVQYYVNLGSNAVGWQLKLEPVGFTAPPVSMDIVLSPAAMKNSLRTSPPTKNPDSQRFVGTSESGTRL